MSEVKDNLRSGLGARCWRSGLAAAEKSEFGVCGVVGGKMVIELLAGAMRSVRGRIAAEGTKATVAIYFGNQV